MYQSYYNGPTSWELARKRTKPDRPVRTTGKPFAGSGATFSDEARRNGREDMLHFVEANQALLRAARAKRSRGLVLRTGTS